MSLDVYLESDAPQYEPEGKYALDIEAELSGSGSDRPAFRAPSHFGEVRHG